MRSETIKIYKFEELSKEVQQEIIEKYRNMDDFSFGQFEGEMLKEYFEEECFDFGFEDVEINCSLNNCQGDGVSFYGNIDFIKFIKFIERNSNSFKSDELILLKELNESCAITIKSEKNRSGNMYSHKNTMDISVGLDNEMDNMSYDMVDLLGSFDYVITRELKELSDRLEKEGYKDIEERYSDKFIQERIIDIDLEYFKNGREYSYI